MFGCVDTSGIWLCGEFFNYAITFVITEEKSVQGLEMLRFALYSDGAGLWVKSQIALGKIKGRGGSVQLRAGLGWLVSLRGDSKNRTCLWPSGLFGLVHKCLGGWFHLYQHYLTLHSAFQYNWKIPQNSAQIKNNSIQWVSRGFDFSVWHGAGLHWF